MTNKPPKPTKTLNSKPHKPQSPTTRTLSPKHYWNSKPQTLNSRRRSGEKRTGWAAPGQRESGRASPLRLWISGLKMGG